MDPITATTAVVTYLGLKDLVPKILGPTADYLGQELRSYSEKGTANLRRIFENAGEKLGEKLNESGQVSPKVLKNILDEGYFSEDTLAAEYFGGVLASARSNNSRDDRGATFVKLVSRLSVYQLRMHYVFYSVVRNRNLGKDINLFQRSECLRHLKTFLSFEDVVTGLEIQDDEDISTIIPHIVHGLIREGLIEGEFVYGSAEHINKTMPGLSAATKPGMVMIPAPLGAELFLWAFGRGELSPAALLDAKIEFPAVKEVKCPLS